MKKGICLICALLLLLCLVGCKSRDTVSFYYPRTQVQYGTPDGILAAEERELPVGQYDLEYLLKLYLEGPVSQELYAPFPKGTALLSVSVQDGTATVLLSEPFEAQENLEHMIACAAIASTCFSLTEADRVSIQAGDFSIILSRDTLVLTEQAGTVDPQ